MMSCRDVAELASAHLDGQLSTGQRVRIRMHLAMCRHCRRLVRQLRATVRALAGVRDLEPPVGADEEARLLELFRRGPGP